jgi:hypothetical protein
MHSPVAININFDSLNENLGFPQGFKDPSFFEVFDNFLDFSNKHNFKYSIYIIGKDLENPELKARVKDWSQAGHEIGNHSYTHHLNLGGLKKDALKYQILKAHEIIESATGKAPRGMICPAWATSARVVEILIENNYLYDTSVFPSFIIYPSFIKNAINHLGKPKKFREIVTRRDILYPLSKPIKPFFADKRYRVVSSNAEEKILVLPLPTLGRSNMAIWHTLLFVFGLEKGKKMLLNYLNRYDYFYYLMHPADLMSQDAVKGKKHTIERMDVSLETKIKYAKEIFELIEESKRPIVTMEQLALNFIENSKNKG